MLKLTSLWAVPLIFLLAVSASFAESRPSPIESIGDQSIGGSIGDRSEMRELLKNYLRYRERMHQNYGESQRFKPLVAQVSSNNTELVGSYKPDSRERFADLYVSGNYVYLGNSFDGLRVIDVSDPANPKEVGAFPNYTAGVFTLDRISGETVLRATGTPLIFPAGVALDRNGTLFVADFGRRSSFSFSVKEQEGAILRVDLETGEIKTVVKGDPLIHPLGITIDETGALIVTSSARGKSGVFLKWTRRPEP